MRREDSRDRQGGPKPRGSGSAFGKPHRRRDRKDDALSRARKKTCRFCEEKLTAIDYKDLRRLERLVSERGKILSRRITGTCAKHQRKVEDAIKKARFMALLPFLKK